MYPPILVKEVNMNITLEQYILNPQIKSNAVLNATAREAIRGTYLKKFDAILLRERGKIDYTLYKDFKNNRFFAHFKIPSETVEKFYYDTILEFFTDENISNTGDLLKYYVKFYSNDPAFVYTHAHAFSVNNLFISELSSKMSKKALKTEAKEKNPYNQIGYVKSIYFAYLTMKNKGLNHKDKFEAECKTFSKSVLLLNVENADKKVEDREAAGEKVRKKKIKERKQQNSDNIKITPSSLGVKKTKTTNSTIKKTKIVGLTKTTKRK